VLCYKELCSGSCCPLSPRAGGRPWWWGPCASCRPRTSCWLLVLLALLQNVNCNTASSNAVSPAMCLLLATTAAMISPSPCQPAVLACLLPGTHVPYAVASSNPSVMPSTSESRYRKSKGFCSGGGGSVQGRGCQQGGDMKPRGSYSLDVCASPTEVWHSKVQPLST
jgi:hypothetical protein